MKKKKINFQFVKLLEDDLVFSFYFMTRKWNHLESHVIML